MVEITDFSPKVVEDMLRFMYTSQEISLNLHQDPCRDYIAELMKASDKYHLGLLNEACDEALSMKIFVEYMNKVIKGSDDWKKCFKNHPDLTV